MAEKRVVEVLLDEETFQLLVSSNLLQEVPETEAYLPAEGLDLDLRAASLRRSRLPETKMARRLTP